MTLIAYVGETRDIYQHLARFAFEHNTVIVNRSVHSPRTFPRRRKRGEARCGLDEVTRAIILLIAATQGWENKR